MKSRRKGPHRDFIESGCAALTDRVARDRAVLKRSMVVEIDVWALEKRWMKSRCKGPHRDFIESGCAALTDRVARDRAVLKRSMAVEIWRSMCGPWKSAG